MGAGMKTLSRPETGPPISPEIPRTPAEELFTESIDMVRKAQVHELPDFTRTLQHSGFLTPFPHDAFEPGIHVDSQRWGVVAERGAPDRFTFIGQDWLRIGRDESYRGVFFGNMVSTWFNDGTVANEQVAVTPSLGRFPQDYQESLQEIAIHQYLEQLGVPTLEVLGMLVVERPEQVPRVFKISRFRPYETLNNINWRGLTEDQRWDRMGLALDTLARLHAHLVFHGDPVFKNIGFGQTEGDIVVIDTEKSLSAALAIHPSQIEKGEQRIMQLMSNDFSRLCLSVDHEILSCLPEGERPHGLDRFEVMLEHVYIPYFERLVHMHSPFVSLLKTQLFDRVVARKMQEAEGTA
jgi:hypothetical protein